MLDNTNQQRNTITFKLREILECNTVLRNLNERGAHNQRFIKFMTEVLIFAVKWYRHVSTRTLFDLVHYFFVLFSVSKRFKSFNRSL